MKLSTATEILREAGIEDALFEARLLFSDIGKIPKTELYGRDAECDSKALYDAVMRRANREPIQYIVGNVAFFREEYKVTPDCLIPRPDTEILVEEVIGRLPSGKRFIDICTGSGCIALSILNNTDSTEAVALDISSGALAVARENADSLSLSDRISFIEADALACSVDGSFYAVVSNPPYVTPKAYECLQPEIYFEPSIAFLGGEDGLVFYRTIIEKYKDSLEEGGFFAFEIGYDQADALRGLAAEHS
ncbi:MAG: peptide chain release factor N(5)-glutamine methyltransferase, partial [Clostridia bacterium]|nr:peptide chain release factor N(5)-glutamine methyltransferase [Clostridia bacterium]